MNAQTKKFVRKLARLADAVDAAREASSQASDFDAGFDAGEFSGPAHDRALAAEIDALAEKFGFDGYDVAVDAAVVVGVAPLFSEGFRYYHAADSREAFFGAVGY